MKVLLLSSGVETPLAMKRKDVEGQNDAEQYCRLSATLYCPSDASHSQIGVQRGYVYITETVPSARFGLVPPAKALTKNTKETHFVFHNGEKVAFCQQGRVHLTETDTGGWYGITPEQVKEVFRQVTQFNSM
jgi:hypothetical protein